jgi:hypothetical protein
MNDEQRAELLLPFDDDGIEQLLAGDPAGPDEARSVALLLAAARQPATADEIADEAVFTALFREAHAARVGGRRRRPLGIKVVAIAGALTIASATGAAAAAGGLPDPVQDTAATLLATVGISVPTADDPAPRDEPVPTTTVAPVASSSSDVVPSTDSPAAPDVPVPIPEAVPAPAPTLVDASAEGDAPAAEPELHGHGDEHGKDAKPVQPEKPGKPDNPGKPDKPDKPDKP